MATATKPKGKRKSKDDEDKVDVVEMTVGGVECRIEADPARYDYGELCELEDFMGKNVDDLTVAEMNGAKGTLILAFLARRRSDPTFTLEQAKRLKPGEIEVRDTRPTETSADSGDESS